MTTPHTFLSSRLVLTFALVLGGALALVGCDAAGTVDAEGERGQLTVLLTDAPGDITKAEVTITRVAIVPSDDTAEGDADEGGLEVLADDSLTVDLLTLQDGVTTALGEIEIPAGSYSQIRLITAPEADVEYEAQDGTTQPAELMMPSAAQSGIKINFDAFTIDEGSDQVEVTLDFNVEDSFVQTGQAGRYLFKPVVQAESVVTNAADDAPADGAGG